jgi:hypothetical protein
VLVRGVSAEGAVQVRVGQLIRSSPSDCTSSSACRCEASLWPRDERARFPQRYAGGPARACQTAAHRANTKTRRGEACRRASERDRDRSWSGHSGATPCWRTRPCRVHTSSA